MVFRLLNTSTLHIELFIGSQHPRYAILSHVWEPGHELTFQEMNAIIADVNHRATNQSGYTKIVDSCRMAKDLGLNYVWVDTVCIDKTSSAELSEAINSMYRWYSEAEVCLVFLADYDGAALDVADGLRHCRWFTRGWCLQELLAPRDLRFFDTKWNMIGTKKELATTLSNITNITEAVLDDNKLISQTPIAQRLSWASKRQTTVEEDMAYCLLGILDVNMPMLYGEGPKAFLRLQEEIVKSTNDMSLFAHVDAALDVDIDHDGSPSTVFNLLATSPAAFQACGSMLNSDEEAGWNDNYIVTNKGMCFRRASLEVLPRHGLYRMSLQCASSTGTREYMYLRKIGPNHYCRCRPAWERNTVIPNVSTFRIIEDEVYVVLRASIRSSEQMARVSDFAIHISSKHNISGALQILQRTQTTRLWDVSRMELLTINEPTVVAYWKIFPKLLGSSSQQYCDHYPDGPVYLVCGCVQYRDDSTSMPTTDRGTFTRLYRVEEWRKMERQFGIITEIDSLTAFFHDNDPVFMGERDNEAEVVIDALKVTAEITLKVRNERPRYELVLAFEHTSPVTQNAA